MTAPKPQLEGTAIASLSAAGVGAIASQVLGGWAALLGATCALVLGLLALSRIKRNGHTGRWLAVVGIGLGAAFYTLLIVIVVRDIIDPVTLY